MDTGTGTETAPTTLIKSQPPPLTAEMKQHFKSSVVSWLSIDEKIAVLQGQAMESQARAAKVALETELLPMDAETDRLKVLTTNVADGDVDEKEFLKRAKIAELVLKEREIESKEAIVNKQMQDN